MRSPTAVALTGVVAGYAIGSLPMGLWLSRLRRGVDVREHGSGSSGATNVLRVAGPAAGAATLVLDATKGAAAIRVCRALGGDEDAQALAGLAAVVGHSWPVWARFRGGKSVATAYGALIALDPRVVVPLTTIGGNAALLMTRTVSIGSLSAAATATTVTAVRAAAGGRLAPYLFAAGATGIIVARHSANIGRISRGREPRLDVGRLLHRR